MKKLIVVLLFILCLSFQASAWNPMVVVSGSEETSCPAYYADTNVTFSADFNHDDGVLYGCDSSGNAILGTDDGSTTHTDWGETGIGWLKTADDGIIWLNTAQAYLNGDAAYTIWVRVHIDGPCAAWSGFFEAYEQTTPGNNSLVMNVTPTAQRADGFFEGNNDGGDTVRANGYADNAWDNLGYSWDPDNIDHATNTATGTGDWVTKDDNITAMNNDIYAFQIGTQYRNAGACAGGHIYIDKFVIISGYQAGLPTNW